MKAGALAVDLNVNEATVGLHPALHPFRSDDGAGEDHHPSGPSEGAAVGAGKVGAESGEFEGLGVPRQEVHFAGGNDGKEDPNAFDDAVTGTGIDVDDAVAGHHARAEREEPLEGAVSKEHPHVRRREADMADGGVDGTRQQNLLKSSTPRGGLRLG